MVNSIFIQNFRNLSNININNITKKFWIVKGLNASGKTNFLDSLYMLGTNESFKNIKNIDSIAKSYVSDIKIPPYFTLSYLHDDNSNHKIIFQSNTKKKLYILNNKAATVKNYLSTTYIPIIFAPESIITLTDGPDVRREEIDNYICIINKEYRKILNDFELALKNRNQLLKKHLISDDIFQYWNDKYIYNAGLVINARKLFLFTINPYFTSIAKEVFHFEVKDFYTRYSLKSIIMLEDEISYIDILRQTLSDNLVKESILEQTLYGPHRDDIEFILNDQNLKVFGSRGQQRLSSLILKLSFVKYVKSITDKDIVLLLDDIPSELDDLHIKKLILYLNSLDIANIILTCTELSKLTDVIYDIEYHLIDLNLENAKNSV